MKDPTLVVAGMLTLSAGTFAFRFSGPALRQRVTFPPWAERLLEAAAVVLLAALVATTALTKGHGFAGLARPAGVLAGGVLAWRKAPFLVVVLAAAAVTAVLRLLGVPLLIFPNGPWCTPPAHRDRPMAPKDPPPSHPLGPSVRLLSE
jgi:branched-subunit amino acid transport protein